MTTPINTSEVKWKQFIPWLMQQPDERMFDYLSSDNCLLCIFLKETHGIPNPILSSNEYTIEKDVKLLPRDLVEAFKNARINSKLGQKVYVSTVFTFGQMKKGFQEYANKQNNINTL